MKLDDIVINFDKNDLDFLLECFKLKNVSRKVDIGSGDKVIDLTGFRRLENSAEHSWGIGLLSVYFRSKNPDLPLNFDKVYELSEIHDLIEVIVGDVFAWDTEARIGKEQRESEAASKFFENNPYFNDLFNEYHNLMSDEARFVKSLDKLEPAFTVLSYSCRVCVDHKITKQRATDTKLEYVISPLRPVLYFLMDEMEKRGLFYNGC